jgi:hypothetical protein
MPRPRPLYRNQMGVAHPHLLVLCSLFTFADYQLRTRSADNRHGLNSDGFNEWCFLVAPLMHPPQPTKLAVESTALCKIRPAAPSALLDRLPSHSVQFLTSAITHSQPATSKGRPHASAKSEPPVVETTQPSPSTHKPVPTHRATKPVVSNEFDIEFQTTKGNMTFRAHREWAPLGVEQLHKMVSMGFFNGGSPTGPDPAGGIGIFRCVPQFVVQFGIHGVSVNP